MRRCNVCLESWIMCFLSTPRPIYRLTYRPTLDWCISWHIGWVSADMSADTTTEICWSTYRTVYRKAAAWLAPGAPKLLAWAPKFLWKEPKRARKNLSEQGSFPLNIHINFVTIKLTLNNKTVNNFCYNLSTEDFHKLATKNKISFNC